VTTPAVRRAGHVRKRADFERIQGSGERVDTRHFVFVLATQSPPGQPRLGITASRRIGNAPARIRAKRLVREAFRSTRELWPQGIDLVVIVRKPLADLKLAAVVEEWRGASQGLARRMQKLGRVAPEPAGAKTGPSA
jgi:ribonuclease P protein component